MIQDNIKDLINNALTNLGIDGGDFVVEHPADLSMGDYSTNVAMALAKSQGSNPRELAEKIVAEMSKTVFDMIEKIEVAGPGFINFYLSREFFAQSIKDILGNTEFGRNDRLAGKKVMVEYTDPNPFKPFHIGHLMSNSIGEAISRLVEFSGAETIRANYQGDVGLHVAKAIYGLQEKGKPSESMSIEDQAEYIGMCYSGASNLYEDDESIKQKINEINKKVYTREDAEINKLYDWGREVTLQAFETVYKKLGTKFKHYFFESAMAKRGEEIVRANTGLVFSESNGAIVFHGEEYDPKLHTRVFINSQGLPTYECKEIGLTVTKFEKENPDLSIIITAVEQGDYMRVVQKAVSLIHPDYEKRMKHITHGMLRFATGKMSSRKGNIITGESLIKEVEYLVGEKIKDRDFSAEEKVRISTAVGIAAIKYSILKQSSGGDVVYDFEKSISFEGDSGPYLQYSYARAKTLIDKAKAQGIESSTDNPTGDAAEVEKILYRFSEVALQASDKFEPHYVANYLIELARSYNSFYGNTQIVDAEDETSAYKVALTEAFASVMKNGLWLLGIETPEKM